MGICREVALVFARIGRNVASQHGYPLGADHMVGSRRTLLGNHRHVRTIGKGNRIRPIVRLQNHRGAGHVRKLAPQASNLYG